MARNKNGPIVDGDFSSAPFVRGSSAHFVNEHITTMADIEQKKTRSNM